MLTRGEAALSALRAVLHCVQRWSAFAVRVSLVPLLPFSSSRVVQCFWFFGSAVPAVIAATFCLWYATGRGRLNQRSSFSTE